MKCLDGRKQTACHNYGFILCTLYIQRTVRPVCAVWGMLQNCWMFLYVSEARKLLDFCWSCIILAGNWYHSHLHWVCTFVLYHGNAYASWSHTCRQINKPHCYFENINGIRNDIRKAASNAKATQNANSVMQFKQLLTERYIQTWLKVTASPNCETWHALE
jgi:hypothetical protein